MLLEHDIRPTANRITLVKALGEAEHPLTMSELEDAVDTIDKSNVFRALALFREQHLVHVMEDGADAVRYELCHSHDDEHDNDVQPDLYRGLRSRNRFRPLDRFQYEGRQGQRDPVRIRAV